MSTIDYQNVKREDLEMGRLPRKSQITVTHKPTGKVADDPVVPGSLTPARFRRPANMPKENRAKGMEGYIEGREEDSKQFYVILSKSEGAEEDKNEYLEALAGDPEALKISFEGQPKPSKGESSSSEGGTASAEGAAAVSVAEDAPEDFGPDATDDAVDAPDDAAAENVEQELDDLLAELHD